MQGVASKQRYFGFRHIGILLHAKLSMLSFQLTFYLLTISISLSQQQRFQVYNETQNADDPGNTLDIIYYNDRTCEIRYRQAKRSQLGWVCDNGAQQGGGCIYRTYLCDGFINCPNGQDEDPMFCRNRQCELSKGEDFRCPSGRCLPAGLRCNGRPDCPVGNKEDRLAFDELFCPCSVNGPTAKRRKSGATLPLDVDENDGFFCRTSYGRQASAKNRCLLKSAFCDGQRDCDDGEDENPIVCGAIQHFGVEITSPTPPSTFTTSKLLASSSTTTTKRPTTTPTTTRTTTITSTSTTSTASSTSTTTSTTTTTTRPTTTSAQRPTLKTSVSTDSSSSSPVTSTTKTTTTITPIATSNTRGHFLSTTRAVPDSSTSSRLTSTTVKVSSTISIEASSSMSTAAGLVEALNTVQATDEDPSSPFEEISVDDDDDSLLIHPTRIASLPAESSFESSWGNSEEVTQSLGSIDHPGGAARQRDEDMVVYVAIGTIAAAVFVGGMIFLIILNVRRSAAMASRKEKQLGATAYSTIPTSAIFSAKQQQLVEKKAPPPPQSPSEPNFNRRSMNCDADQEPAASPLLGDAADGKS